MLYTLILLTVLSLLIIINNFRNSFARWLFGLYLSFCISIIGLVLYSVYFWDYYYLRNILFDINRSVWLFIYSLRLSAYTVNRIVNIGVAFFYYCAFCFSVSYSEETKRPLSFYLLTAVFPLQLLLFYDPYVGNELYAYFNRLCSKYGLSWSFFSLLNYLKLFNRLWFASFIGYSSMNLVRMYRRLTNPYIKHKVLGVVVSIGTTFLLYTMIFYWAPEHITILRGNLPHTVYNYSFESYIILEFYPSILLYYVYPCISLVSLLALLYALYKYNVLEFMDLQHSFRKNASFQIEQMSSAVSHMIKNRLLEIKLSLNDFDRKSSETKERIGSICNHISDRLEVLNSKTKSIRLSFERIEINTLIDSVLADINERSSNIDIVFRPAVRPLICYADREHLSEVIVNLINNSIEAIGENRGKVVIKAHIEQRWNIISISDNGPGVSREDIKHVFSPFYSTKPTSKNWGIGLTYCYKTIKIHKGKITVDSTPGKGVTFNILLPVIPTRMRNA